jgi:hypothetical protein
MRSLPRETFFLGSGLKHETHPRKEMSFVEWLATAMRGANAYTKALSAAYAKQGCAKE